MIASGHAHLEVAGVTAGYGPVPVIRGVSLTVEKNELLAVIGPNGAGKSTLLKAIAGDLPARSGTVTLAGQRIDGLPADRVARRGVGYVPQTRDIFDRLTVKENLQMGGYALGRRAIEDRLSEVLELFPHLAGMRDRRAGLLSGGERKMLAISRVMMTRPTLLILDEPTANLAPKLARSLLEHHIRNLAKHDVAVLLVEQRVRDALAVADRVCVLVDGVVNLTGPAQEISKRADLSDLFLGGGIRPAQLAGNGEDDI
jgi:ABC-type branched-subunit amino acid transport system ATPase component